MTNLEEFLHDYRENGEGEFHCAPEELQDYSNKQHHQDEIVIPTLVKLGFNDEIVPELAKVLKYPGEY